MEEDNFRPLGPKRSPGRTQIDLYHPSQAGECESYEIQYYRARRGDEFRGEKIAKKESNRNSTPYPMGRGILQHYLHGRKERRRLSSYLKPEVTKPTFKRASLQDGDPTKYTAGSDYRGLGVDHRFRGRLFSYIYPKGTPKISSVYNSRSSLPIPGTSVRFGHSSSDFHQNNGSSGGVPTIQSDTDIYVPGRLVSKEPIQGDPDRTEDADSRDTRGVRALDKQRKISAGTHTKDKISRSNLQSTDGSNVSLSTEVPRYKRYDKLLERGRSDKSQRVPKITGPYGGVYRSRTKSTPSSKTYSIPLPESLESGLRPFGKASTRDQGFVATPNMVVTGGNLFQGSSPKIYERQGPLDGCIGKGLGRSPRFLQDARSMGRHSEKKSYKLARIEGCTVSSSSLLSTYNREKSVDKIGQLDCSGLYQQRRGDEVITPLPANVENATMGRLLSNRTESCSHSGQEKYPCGQTIKKPERSKINRMDPRQNCSQENISGVRGTMRGPIRDGGEQTASNLLFPVANRRCLALRCPECRLDWDLRLRISPADPTSSGTTEGDKRDVHYYSNSPHNTLSIMVSDPSESVNRSPEASSHESRFIDTEQRSMDTPRLVENEISSLEDFRCEGRTECLSKKARDYITQSRRPSTRKMYEARQRLFCSWCQERKIHPSSASINEIAEFLIYLHEERNCKAATLSGYRVAISDIHEAWERSTVSNNKMLSRLIKGIYHSNPRRNRLLPSWDLPLVLEALSKPPFEPLRSAELKYLTWKTVFLIALASAARVSELHALSTCDTCLRIEVSGIRLFPKLEFLAKNQRANKAWSSWLFQILRSNLTRQEI